MPVFQRLEQKNTVWRPRVYIARPYPKTKKQKRGIETKGRVMNHKD